MFLALTADDRFWDKSQKILFLSQGCLLHDTRRALWQGLDYEVLPNLWHDPEQLNSAIAYVDVCAEKMLERIGRYLSDLHQHPYHEEHWRIILYAWLQRYIHVLYDRYRHIRLAFEKHADLTTRISQAGLIEPTHDLAHYTHICREDSYNFQICSEIISITNSPPPTSAKENTESVECAPPILEGGFQLRDSVLLYKIHHRHEDMLAQLENSLGDVLQRYPETLFARDQLPTPDPKFDPARNGLINIPADDDFERILVNTLPKSFPTLYLEGYKDSIKTIHKLFPILPRLIISSAHGWYTQEVFKFLAGVAKTQGCQIISMQAGGANGTYKFFAQQAHEERFADRELVWGWAKPDDTKRRTIPCFYTSKILALAALNKNEYRGPSVLFLQAGPLERYLRWMYSTPYGGGSGEPYLAWQMRFLAALPNSTRSNLFYREKPQRDDGQNFSGRIKERFPDLRVEDTYAVPAPDRILDPEVRLIVIDHCSTGYLESFTANKPTILFWDPNLWLMNSVATKLFDDMREVGILHNSPESAARWVQKIYESPLEWWRSDKVQSVRHATISQFGWGTLDWLKYWREAVMSELHAAKDYDGSPTNNIG